MYYTSGLKGAQEWSFDVMFFSDVISISSTNISAHLLASSSLVWHQKEAQPSSEDGQMSFGFPKVQFISSIKHHIWDLKTQWGEIPIVSEEGSCSSFT